MVRRWSSMYSMDHTCGWRSYSNFNPPSKGKQGLHNKIQGWHSLVPKVQSVVKELLWLGSSSNTAATRWGSWLLPGTIFIDDGDCAQPRGVVWGELWVMELLFNNGVGTHTQKHRKTFKAYTEIQTTQLNRTKNLSSDSTHVSLCPAKGLADRINKTEKHSECTALSSPPALGWHDHKYSRYDHSVGLAASTLAVVP